MDKKNSKNLQQDAFTSQVGSSNDVPQSEKRNGSLAEVTPSTSEKDVGTSKVKTQSVKLGKTQSGPLMPGTVLGLSLPERGRAFERYIVFSYYIFIVVLILGCYWKFEMEWNGKRRVREGKEWGTIAFPLFGD